LGFNGLRAATLADLLLLFLDLGEQLHHPAGVVLEARRCAVDVGLEDRTRQNSNLARYSKGTKYL
jgi:hypothetical protein